MKRALFAFSFMVMPLVCMATMPVEVTSKADDDVGNQLVYNIKEQIRQSRSLELTFDQSSYRIVASVVTLDPSRNGSGSSTIYSLVILWDKGDGKSLPLYLTHEVGVCGARQLVSCAQGLVADIASQSDLIIRILENAAKH